MKRIYLIRHCAATGQAPDAPLTEEGFIQAERLVNPFTDENIVKIVTSPYQRAVDTIQPVADKFGLAPLEDERLKEWTLSVSPLEDWQAFLKQSFANLDICYEGGESGREAMTRGITVLRETLDSMGETGDAVLVTHGGMMALMLKHFDRRFGFAEWAHLKNPDVFLLTFEDGPYPRIERLEEI